MNTDRHFEITAGVASLVVSITLISAWPSAADPRVVEPGSGGAPTASVPTPQEPEKPKQDGGGAKGAGPQVDVDGLAARLYRPAEAGLDKCSFVFRHHAFENAGYRFRGARFHVKYQASGERSLEVSGLHESQELMAPRLVEMLDWIHDVTASPRLLETALVKDKVFRIGDQGERVNVSLRMKPGQAPWQLRFREVDGKLRLEYVDSPVYGRVLLRYEDVEGLPIVTSLEIDDPKSALGKWTLRCEDLEVVKRDD